MDISPFRALRYADTEAVDRCVSLPYDQFGDDGRDERYLRHPHNVVRLIKPREDEAPAHEAARAALAAWRADGVLARDGAPAVYPYRQRFTAPGSSDERARWSVIVRLRLTPFAEGPTRPHERTYPDTVGERSHLRETVGADLGLILVAYDDPAGDIDRLVASAAEEARLFEARDESGTANALWKWDDPARTARLQELLAASSGFVADGHHRYTAALANWRERGADADDPAGWVMAALVSSASRGLRILPTHRLTAAAPRAADVAAWERAGMSITPIARGTVDAVAEAAARALADHRDDHAVVYVRRASGEVAVDLLRAPRGSLTDAPWPDDVPASWRELDIAVLHSLVLDPWMAEILRGQTEDHGALGYCNEVAESVRLVGDGDRGAAFLINPLSVAEVQGVVAAGDVLPPKSTNFFPKVIAGLTINPFDDPAVS